MHLDAPRNDAPSRVHVPLIGARKTLWNPSATDRAMRIAINANTGLDTVMPVFHGGRIVGYTRGKPGSLDVEWRGPTGIEQRATNYNDLIDWATSDPPQRGPCPWAKVHNTAPVANNYMDLWPVGGQPEAGGYTGVALTALPHTGAEAGALYNFGNKSPLQKFSTLGWVLSSGGTPSITLYDRVLTYEACTFVAGQQLMVNTLPATRYVSTGLSGMKIMVTAQTVLNATAANLTELTYVDQDGNGGALMPTTVTVSHIVSAAAPTTTLGARVISPSLAAATSIMAPYLPLAAGDGGARSITSFTWSAAPTGTVCFVMARPLCTIPIAAAGIPSMYDLTLGVNAMERIYDGACLAMLAYFPAATLTNLMGEFDVTWGTPT